MNYKILILIALVASVLLSGCIDLVDNTGNFSKQDKQTIRTSETSGTIANKIIVHQSDNTQDFYVFETVYEGRSYTCFYSTGGSIAGNGMPSSISCTRDVQAVY